MTVIDAKFHGHQKAPAKVSSILKIEKVVTIPKKNGVFPVTSLYKHATKSAPYKQFLILRFHPLRQSRCPCTAPWFHSNFSLAELNIISILCQKLQNERPLYSLVRTSARLRSYFLRRSLRSFFACDRESDFSE